jgi:hypothetical protein
MTAQDQDQVRLGNVGDLSNKNLKKQKEKWRKMRIFKRFSH